MYRPVIIRLARKAADDSERSWVEKRTAPVRANGVRRKKDDAMSLSSELAPPVMRHPACLHHDGSGRPGREERRELGPRKTVTLSDAAGLMGYRNLKDGFRDVDGNGRPFHQSSCRFAMSRVVLAHAPRQRAPQLTGSVLRTRSPFDLTER